MRGPVKDRTIRDQQQSRRKTVYRTDDWAGEKWTGVRSRRQTRQDIVIVWMWKLGDRGKS